MRGNFRNNIILAEWKISPKLLNFSEIFNIPIYFHNKVSSNFFSNPLTIPCVKTGKDLF